MKPEQIYQDLVGFAEKFGIAVSEQSFRHVGFKPQSGLCTVKGQKRFIIDKHLKVSAKIELLAEHLSLLPHEDVYMRPALRDVLMRFRPAGDPGAASAIPQSPPKPDPA